MSFFECRKNSIEGLVALIYRLLRRDETEDPIIKWFSKPMAHQDQGPFKDELFDIDSFIISEISRRIKDVFGSDSNIRNSQSSDGESTSLDDENDEHNGDDDDDPLQNEVDGNDLGEHSADFDTPFDEDFCIQFQNSNPFLHSSLSRPNTDSS
ncbi:uncharacterized protein Z519_10110 [Cladophialophora bantiana CBS 173.52]|uniref:Uncharacterized protein n=1 Tax=Cladophialophora bantiana (strain ATCC 10958 / CBS 173.52 / CDC B-1940 / NIH 8579) TaxID=1442370 RepID=A0A0D2FRN6_CLAB1|nr:uncharacterized protein Z519_10110 [Cladophialophora bantiana CBS 173.52]KIW89257.1 hypothetical protein Z519_10110 [Cladophialophora bantiana CBS 173.52]